MLALVTKSKPIYGNILAYDTKTNEYVYLHKKREIWREPSTHIDITTGHGELLNFFLKLNGKPVDEDALENLNEFPIFQKYANSCELI